ncbi:hypothetical protein ACTXT7_014651 [Hymenolepis weldensis]
MPILMTAWPAALANGNVPPANDKRVFFGNGIPKTNEPAIPNLGVSLPEMEPEKAAAQAVPTLASTLPTTPKKKPFFKKYLRLSTIMDYFEVANIKPSRSKPPYFKKVNESAFLQQTPKITPLLNRSWIDSSSIAHSFLLSEIFVTSNAVVMEKVVIVVICRQEELLLPGFEHLYAK